MICAIIDEYEEIMQAKVGELSARKEGRLSERSNGDWYRP